MKNNTGLFYPEFKPDFQFQDETLQRLNASGVITKIEALDSEDNTEYSFWVMTRTGEILESDYPTVYDKPLKTKFIELDGLKPRSDLIIVWRDRIEEDLIHTASLSLTITKIS